MKYYKSFLLYILLMITIVLIDRSYTTEKSKWLQEKQIDIRTNFNNPSHTRRCQIEKTYH